MILDEPINGLDPESIVEIRELLLKLNREEHITIVISSHILSELSLLCTDYLFLNKGRLLQTVSSGDLKRICKEYYHINTDNNALALAILQKKLEDIKAISQTLCYSLKELTGGLFGVLYGGSCFIVLGLLVVLLTARIAGWDYTDKTMNYELMTGHRRREVFLGRVIPAMLVGGVGALFFTILPIGIYGGIYGWGTKVVFSRVLLRWVLMLLPYLRMVCEFAFLTFLIRNPYVVMGLGYVVFMIATLISSAATNVVEAGSMVWGINNVSLLLAVSKWETYGLGGDTNYIFDASLNAAVVWGTILFSLVIGVSACAVSLYGLAGVAKRLPGNKWRIKNMMRWQIT